MRKNWESLEVRSQNFVDQQPVTGFCSQQGSQPQIVIFGGQGVNSYYFQHSDVQKGAINMKQMRSAFKEKPGFCQGNDSVIKMFNSKLYALDSSQKQMHIFDASTSIWSTKSLADYKIPLSN